jgi:cyclophilin family peptidyl-prolyl cis-trans isomerase
MAVRGTPYGRATLLLALAGIILATSGLGCKRRVATPGGKSAQAADTAKGEKKPGSLVEARFQRPFADATRKDPLDGWDPPTTTATGKSVGALYEQVKSSWDGIAFVNAEGKRIVYHAVLDTEDGTVVIELRPDWAPNHVRNFVALARAGYYDGLVFSRTVNQLSRKLNERVELIEGGGPQGVAGDQDGIGYWLKDEFDAKLAQEDGVVGASHGEEADSAACKFYVMLSTAPRLNGLYSAFGKVVKGLDVARIIAKKPAEKEESGSAEESEDLEGGDYRPTKPAVIRKVTIETHEVDKPGPGGDN